MNFRDPNFGDMPKCHLEYVLFRSTYCYWMYFDRFKISAPFRTSHQNVWAMGVGRWKGQSIFVVYLIRSVCSMHVLFLECHVHMFLRGWNIEEDSPLVWPGLFQQLSPENYQWYWNVLFIFVYTHYVYICWIAPAIWAFWAFHEESGRQESGRGGCLEEIESSSFGYVSHWWLLGERQALEQFEACLCAGGRVRQFHKHMLRSGLGAVCRSWWARCLVLPGVDWSFQVPTVAVLMYNRHYKLYDGLVLYARPMLWICM